MKQMSENKRLGPMHPNPYFVDEKTEVGLLTTSHQSLSEMSHHLFTYSKMMPWFLQVLRSRMSWREAKEKEEKRKGIIIHELTAAWLEAHSLWGHLTLLFSPWECSSPTGPWFIRSLFSQLLTTLIRTPLSCYFPPSLWLLLTIICCLFTRQWTSWGVDFACLFYSSAPVPWTVSDKKI